MLKIACIFSFKESSWVSCQKIVKNLHLAYEQVKGIELENFNLSTEMENYELEVLASKICQHNPDIISILDHKPHPFPLIQQILKRLKTKKKPKFIFHVFGDFTLYYGQWHKLSQLLLDYEVEFLVASPRQKKLIDNLLLENKSIVCPFPFNPNELYFSKETREKIRKSWGMTDKDKVFVFTGRLSKQKRVKTLISLFANQFQGSSDCHLFLYGNPDNIGEPFFSRTELDGEYFRGFYSLYKNLPKKIQEKIHFKGSIPNSELFEVYQGCDILINLSVHNDEDYGMSVAEAQACGLPAVLTDWGGLAGFSHKDMPEAVSFIPVKIGRYSKIVNTTIACEAMNHQFKNSFEIQSRHKLAELAKKRFSINSSSEIISNLIHKEFDHFKGFGPLFYRMIAAETMLPHRNIYIDGYRRITKLYRDIYDAYTR